MNRRSFLGWLGGSAASVAVYQQFDTRPELAKYTDQQLTEGARGSHVAPVYVIKNESQLPMVVYYKSSQPQHDDRPAHGAVHVSTLLLPDEELTITAVPAKL